MANVLIADGLEQLASATVAGLYHGGILINTVWRDAEASFQVGKGDTVSIKEPLPVAATNFTGAAVVSDLIQAKIAIVIDQQPYNQVKLTARERTLYIENFVSEVLLPGTQGIAEYIDEYIAAFMATTTSSVTSPGADGWTGALSAARQQLSVNGVPAGNRWLAAAPDVISGILNSAVVMQGNLNNAGDALANGYIGRYMGFNIVESNYIPAATAYAYHETAIAAIFRTPVEPEGARTGSSTLNGLSAQVVYSYDNTLLSDVITQHTLFGLGSSNATFDQRIVKVTLLP